MQGDLCDENTNDSHTVVPTPKNTESTSTVLQNAFRAGPLTNWFLENNIFAVPSHARREYALPVFATTTLVVLHLLHLKTS
jgi:hypothetical protein